MIPPHLLSPSTYGSEALEAVKRCDRCGQPGDAKYHHHADERVAVLDTAGGTDYKCIFCTSRISAGEEHWLFMWEPHRAHSGCATAVYGPR